MDGQTAQSIAQLVGYLRNRPNQVVTLTVCTRRRVSGDDEDDDEAGSAAGAGHEFDVYDVDEYDDEKEVQTVRCWGGRQPATKKMTEAQLQRGRCRVPPRENAFGVMGMAISNMMERRRKAARERQQRKEQLEQAGAEAGLSGEATSINSSPATSTSS